MGYVRARVRGDGQMRYAATYLDVQGRQLSAGTYATEAQAMRACLHTLGGADDTALSALRSIRRTPRAT